MRVEVKNMSKNLAVTRVMPTFVMPNVHYTSEYTYFNRNNAGLLSRYYSLSSGRLATKSEGARSFCIHIIKLSDLCQTSLKAQQPRSTVAAVHCLLYRSMQHHPIDLSTTRTPCGLTTMPMRWGWLSWTAADATSARQSIWNQSLSIESKSAVI